MPKVQEKIPENLRVYNFHGVNLEWNDSSEQAVGDCPFCGRDGKFSVLIESGVWRCFVCNEGSDKGKSIQGGNQYIFIRKLHEMSYDATNPEDYNPLALDRRLSPMTLLAWNVCKSIINGDWLLPGYSPDGKLNQLYRYIGSPERKLIPTPTLGHQLHYQSYDPSKGETHILEGPWDGMAWWETLREAKFQGDALVSTGNEAGSLLANVNVIAAPGCETFKEEWLCLLTEKDNTWLYDSDHPREHNGRAIPPAGFTGLSRVAGLAARNASPKSLSYLKWGENGFDPAKPSGYDVRDHLTRDLRPPASRLTRLGELLRLITPFPVEELKTQANGVKSNGNPGKELTPLKCKDYKTLQNAWRKAMKWGDGLEGALGTMLACVVSTMQVGDQLWVKVMSPASGGKTSLVEGLMVARKYVKAPDTIRGFTSGFKAENGETCDLATSLDSMTLVTVDGDTLLQLPNLPGILSESRRLYDGTLHSHFKNNTGKSVESHRMTWILCGTGSLRKLDSAELGARFLDYVIMDNIDEDLEDEILMRVAHKSSNNVSRTVNVDDASSQKDAATIEAMRLTGGYVLHLRENAEEMISSVNMGDEALLACARFGKLIAFMRARPSKSQEEVQEREMGGRLVSQIVRLAKCLAAVMNKKSVDQEVMKRVRKVALDTSKGHSLDLIEKMMDYPRGCEVKQLHHLTGREDNKIRAHLRYMQALGMVDLSKAQVKAGVVSKSLWYVTPRLRKLYSDVMEE